MYQKIFLFVFVFALLTNGMAQDVYLKSVEELRQELNQSPTGTEHVRLLLYLALAYVHKPGEEVHDLDTALLLTKEAELINTTALHDKAIEAKLYFVYATALREKGDTARGHFYIKKSIIGYQSVNWPDDAGNAYMESINYMPYETLDDVRERVRILRVALTLFKQSGNREMQASALKDLADYNQILSNYGEATVQLNEALDIYKALGKKDVQGLYDLLGSISSSLGDYTNGVKYGLLALQLAESQHDTSMQLCTIYNRLGISYKHWKRFGEAEFYLRKAITIALKYHEKYAVETILLNLNSSLVKQRKLKESLSLLNALRLQLPLIDADDSLSFFIPYYYTYRDDKNFKEMKNSGEVLIRIEHTLTMGVVHGNLYDAIVDYLLSAHRFVEAQQYMVKFFRFAKNSNSVQQVADAYLRQAKLDSAMGNFKSALANFNIYKEINDSLLDETRSFQFAQLQVAYETGKKNDSLKINQQEILNLTTNNRLKEADLKQADLVRNAIILAAITFLSVLYIGYRFKQRSNAKLQAQQQAINQQNQILQHTLDEKNNLLVEKEWLVKEIHHRVKNNLQIMTSLLNTQSKYLNNKEAIEAITESRHRMQAMSLIHQKLYQSDDMTFVNVQQYIAELIDYLKTSLADERQINFSMAVESLELDVAQAIPLGLIVNEAITNALKYAFIGRSAGTVHIALHKHSSLTALLQISDNGLGAPPFSNPSDADSMGMRLIKGLVKQIGGSLLIESKEGLRINVIFNTDSVLKKISAISVASHHETRMYG